MYFVLPNTDSYVVKINGTDITNKTTKDILPKIENWKPNLELRLIEPYSKESISEFGYNNNLYGIAIPIEIKSNERIEFEISYISESGYYNRDDLKHTVYSYIYYLTPASFWEDEVDVELFVNLPEHGKYKLFSNIDLIKVEKNQYKIHLSKLPDEEFLLSLVDSKGLIFNTNNTKEHNKYVIFVAVAIILLSVLISIFIKKKLAIVLGYILSNVFIFNFLGKLYDGYITDMIIYFFLICILWILIPTVSLILYLNFSRVRRKKTR